MYVQQRMAAQRTKHRHMQLAACIHKLTSVLSGLIYSLNTPCMHRKSTAARLALCLPTDSLEAPFAKHVKRSLITHLAQSVPIFFTFVASAVNNIFPEGNNHFVAY